MKWLKYIIVFLLFLVFLSLFGFAVMHMASGGQKLGPMTSILRNFVLLPKLLTDKTDPLKVKWHANYLDKEPIHELDYAKEWSLQGLSSEYDIPNDKWVISHMDLRTDSVYRTWEIPLSAVEVENFQFAFVNLPIMLQDHSLVASIHATKNMLRIGADSEVIWHNKEHKFHHGMNLDADGNLWAIAYGNRFVFNYNTGSHSKYMDDLIVKLDIETGETLYKRSLTDILKAKGKESLIYRYSNAFPAGKDPLHTNDIQPALSTTAHWEAGDIFLSVRNRSAIIHYRPETDSLINILQGPFTNQHDVDIISESKIALFNNNMFSVGIEMEDGGKAMETDTMRLSSIVTYDFASGEYSTAIPHHFSKQNIFTATQGCFEYLPSGHVYVESQNEGYVYLFSEDAMLMKRSLPSLEDGAIPKPHWVRVWE